jgi:hypothetical protein
MQAKKGTPEYLSCHPHPHSDEAVRYHASFARPTSKPEIFSFAGAEDFPIQGTTKSSSSSSRAPHITCSEEFAHMRGLPNDSLRERIARRGQFPAIMAPLSKAHIPKTPKPHGILGKLFEYISTYAIFILLAKNIQLFLPTLLGYH